MTLRVTLEIVPFGEEEKKYEIGKLNISNIGPLGDIPGFYEYAVHEFPTDKPLQHMRDQGAWALVRQAVSVHHAKLFEDMYPSRSKLRK